jgi:hypothetical protein
VNHLEEAAREPLPPEAPTGLAAPPAH